MNPVAARPASAELELQASHLAKQLGIPLLSSFGHEVDYPLILDVGAGGLTLVPRDRGLGKGLRIDFAAGSTGYRRMAAGSTRQPLAKAVGLRQGLRSVIDATAGLGRDSFLLACLGCRVMAVERSTILAAMLKDAIERARDSVDLGLRTIVGRMEVVTGESKEVLPKLPSPDRAEVVYLDPMYVPSESTALAKKEMRLLRLLVGADEDASELLKVAREVARKRVVVKRHRRAEPLAEDVSISFPGRSVRYDVYLSGL